VPGSVVDWNGTPLPTAFVNQDELTAAIPAADLSAERTASITVTSPVPGGGVSNAVPFAVTNPSRALSFTKSTYSVGNSVISLVAADFNHDGLTDLAIVNSSGTAQQCPFLGNAGTGSVVVLLGNGDGTFTFKWSEELSCIDQSLGGVWGLSVTAGDSNGDGTLDLEVLYNDGALHNQIATFLGNGDGTFTYFVSNILGEAVAGPIETGDFNRDGKWDMAFPFFTFLDDIVLLLGNGDGSFDFSALGLPVYISQSLVTGDFNRDGILDLVSGPGSLRGTGPPFSPVLLGKGDGTFTVAPTQPSLSIGAALTTGDFNGDGILDLAFGEYSSSVLKVLLGNGDGTFREKRGQPPVQGFSLLSTADFNGDGNLDLIVANQANHTMSVLRGNGRGGFRHPVVNSVSGGPFSVAAADFNGDGRSDLVTANGDATITVFLNTSPRPATTSTSMVASANPSIYGQSVTWTAAVTSHGPVTPTGRVRFTTAFQTIGEVELDGSGNAALSTSALNAGVYPVTALYLGDDANLKSTSRSVDQTVQQAATTASITSSPNPSTEKEQVVFIARFTSLTLTPVGQVTFAAGTTVLGTAQLNGGEARLVTSSLPAGSTKITASYQGNSNFLGSSASLPQQVH
jgi:Bacterial Ig-like domain (group 3)/FG-GAP-like repeat